MKRGALAPLITACGVIMDSTFRERYEAIFNRVCVFLGNGWRIDLRTKDSYRIYLVNPSYKNYSISARLEKHRIHLLGSVRGCKRTNTWSACTVSPTREPWGIAADIKKRILIDAVNQIAIFEADRAGEQSLREDRDILIGLISRQVETWTHRGYYSGLFSLKTNYGVSGDVEERYGDAYALKLAGLSKTQLIKITGFLSTLER